MELDKEVQRKLPITAERKPRNQITDKTVVEAGKRSITSIR